MLVFENINIVISTYVKIKLYITSKESNLLLISNFAMYDLSFIEARLCKCHNIDSKSFFYYCSASSDKKHESYLNFRTQHYILSQVKKLIDIHVNVTLDDNNNNILSSLIVKLLFVAFTQKLLLHEVFKV